MKRSLSSNFSYSITKELELIESFVIELTLVYQNILILVKYVEFYQRFLSLKRALRTI